MAVQRPDTTHYRSCPLCEAMCGLAIEVEHGRVTAIRGDRHDPFSHGHICPKAVALADIHDDPDRLRRPLRRTASGWQEIGWEEALDEAASQIHELQRAHGRNSVAAYLGNPTVHNLGAMLFVPVFLRGLGSASIFSATSVDQLPHMVAAQQIFGHRLLNPVPDVDRTDYLVILGGNPLASNGSMMTAPDVRRRLEAIRQRGGKLVVIDPRHTETAAVADEHHFIRPGSDAVLLMAVLRELLAAGARLRHLEDLSTGMEKLAELSASFTPERAAAHTGIDAATIRRLAAELRAAPSAAVYGRVGTSMQAFGGLCQWLITAINAVSGNVDREGGVMFTEPAFDLIHGPRAFTAGRGRFGHRRSRVRGLPDFASELPVAVLAEEIETPGDGQIRGLVSFAGNPVLSTPNGGRLDRALASLDFMISIDPYLNETSRHANLILPPPSPLERSHYDVAFHTLAIRNTAKFSPALFEPAPDARHDWQILLELRHRLALLRGSKRVKNTLFYRSLRALGPEGLLAIGLRFGPRGGGLNPLVGELSLRTLRRHPHGIDLGPLRPCLKRRMPTHLQRIDLAPQAILGDVARLDQAFGNSLVEDGDEILSLIGRRHLRDNNSWMHNFERLMRGRPRCVLFMHPADAAPRGLAYGDLVKVSSSVGSVTVALTITDEIMPGVVSLPHGYGHDRQGVRLTVAAAEHAGVSINDLTDDQAVDELTGNAAFSGTPVTVQRESVSGMPPEATA